MSGLVQILGVLLALSLAGNAWLAHTHLGVRDQRTEAIGARDQARAAATACSDATEALQELAVRAKVDNAAAARKAAADALQLQRRAQLQLATPATRPADDCGSAGDRFDRFLLQRGQP